MHCQACRLSRTGTHMRAHLFDSNLGPCGRAAVWSCDREIWARRLEKPRICLHMTGERNYHVFYMLCKASEAIRTPLRLEKWQDFHVLNQKGTVKPQPCGDSDLCHVPHAPRAPRATHPVPYAPRVPRATRPTRHASHAPRATPRATRHAPRATRPFRAHPGACWAGSATRRPGWLERLARHVAGGGSHLVERQRGAQGHARGVPEARLHRGAAD